MVTLGISRWGTRVWGTRALFAAILFFGLLAMTARTATDPDLWWHLRTGQWIVQTGHVPHTDPFSFTRSGKPWVAHEWLLDVTFYELWRLGGPAALIVLASVVTTLGFLFLYWRCNARPHWAAAATVLGAWAAAPCWGVRPQMFTFTLAALLLWLVERAESRPRLLWWIPLLFVVWLNLHGGFAVGLALLLLYAGGLALEAATGETPWHEARPTLLRIGCAILACLALVPVNPSGARLYLYPLETLVAKEPRSLIVEWFSPDFHLGMYLPCLLVILLPLSVFAWVRPAIRWRMLLPLAFMLIAALDAVRHIPIFMLLAVPVIAQGVSSAERIADKGTAIWKPQSARRASRQFIYPAAAVALCVFALWRFADLARSQNAHEAEQYPHNAVAFLRTAKAPERLFAYYDWGGYAIWQLFPEYRPFLDGRADVYGDDLLKQFETTVQLGQNWRQVLDTWGVGTVLVPSDSALAQGLWLDNDWTAAYHDPKALVFVRKPARSAVTSGIAVQGSE